MVTLVAKNGLEQGPRRASETDGRCRELSNEIHASARSCLEGESDLMIGRLTQPNGLDSSLHSLVKSVYMLHSQIEDIDRALTSLIMRYTYAIREGRSR